MREVCCGHIRTESPGGYCVDCPDIGHLELSANPYQVVRNFEAALCRYTGAPYAVTVNSCTMALLLACAWHLRGGGKDISHLLGQPDGTTFDYLQRPEIEIPKRTYISVPMSIIHAGGRPTFRDEEWLGAYQLKPLPVWDSARRFTSGMYVPGQMQAVSFQAAKILGDTQGGCILLDDPEANAWLRRMRFDGRAEGVTPIDDTITTVGFHCYLSSDVAARLLLKLHSLPKHNADLKNDNYPDLSTLEVFK